MTLFDVVTRTDASPSAYGEDSFSFMNRVDGPFWTRVRLVLDEWFANYPEEHAADLRARLRSSDPRQHYAAWWELYLHELFLKIGWSVSVHPDVGGASTHPDFLVRRGADAFYLEALTVFSGIVEDGRNGAREAWILDLINEVTSPNFFVGVDFESVGTECPSRAEVIQPIEGWLAGLDADAVAELMRAGDEPPELRLQFRDWDVVVDAMPIKPDARGRADNRTVGRGPVSGGWVNDVDQLRRGFKRKFRRYGELEHPLAVAVLGMSSFVELRDFEQALFGRHAVQYEQQAPYRSQWVRLADGVWRGPAGPRATSVAGVLSAAGIQPWTTVRGLPRLWVNPWAVRPLGVRLPFPTTTVSEAGEVEHGEGGISAADIFDLPADWPGPEDAFE